MDSTSNQTDTGPSPAFVTYEEAYISATLNSTMLYILLMGLYTITYIGGAYLYQTRATALKRPASLFMHALFILGITEMAIQWYFLKFIFVDQGDTRETIFATVAFVKPSIQVGTIVIQYMQFILSNAFLVWRCFYLENYTLMEVSPLIGLIGAQIITYLVATIFRGNATSTRGPETLHQSLLALDTLNIFISATSILCSLYIGKSLISAYIANPTPAAIKEKEKTPRNLERESFYIGPRSLVGRTNFAPNAHFNAPAPGGLKPAHGPAAAPKPPTWFDKALDVLLQSSVLYAITQLAYTIVSFMYTHNTGSAKMFAVVGYVGAVNNTMGGLAPTLMMAQLATIKGKPPKKTSKTSPGSGVGSPAAAPGGVRSALQFGNAAGTTTTTYDLGTTTTTGYGVGVATTGGNGTDERSRGSAVVSLRTGVHIVGAGGEKAEKAE